MTYSTRLLHYLSPFFVLGVAQAAPVEQPAISPYSIERQPIPQDVLIRPIPAAVDSVLDTRQPPPEPSGKTKNQAQPVPPTENAPRTVTSSPESHKHSATRPYPRQKRPQAVNLLMNALAQANHDFQTQRYNQVLDALQPFETQIFNTRNVDAARLQGWAAWHTGNLPLAQKWFQRAANWTNLADDMANVVRAELAQNNFPAALKQLNFMPDNQGAHDLRMQVHQAYALHAFNANDYVQAIQQLSALEALRPLDAGEQEIRGWSNYKLGHFAAASQSFEKSLVLSPFSQGAAQGLIFSLNAQNNLAEVYRIRDTLGADTPLAQLTADPLARARLLSRSSNPRIMLDASAHILPAPYAPPAEPSHARTELFVRNSETSFNQGDFNTEGLRIEGLLSGDRYRLLAEARVFNAEDEYLHESSLKDVYLQGRYYDTDGFEWMIGLGSTPQGGVLNPTWRGELGFGSLDSAEGFRIRVARRNVEQSVLSISGRMKSASAEAPKVTWGQVMREGIELEGYRTIGAWKAEGSLALAQLRGVNVADNRMFELYANMLHPVPRLLDGLALGSMLYASGYQKNLSAFTLGNGGYYSPEKMFRLAAMARYQVATPVDSGFNMRLDASLGWQTSDEAAASTDPLAVGASYTLEASHNSGLAATLELDMNYRVNKQWSYGLSFAGQKSPDYSLLSSRIYLMYIW